MHACMWLLLCGGYVCAVVCCVCARACTCACACTLVNVCMHTCVQTSTILKIVPHIPCSPHNQITQQVRSPACDTCSEENLKKMKLNKPGRQESHTYRLTTTRSLNPTATTDLFCQDRSRHSCKVKTGTRWSCHSRSVHQTPQLDTGTCSHSAEADMFHHAGMGCCHRPLTQTRSTHQRNPAIRTISFC